MTPTETTSPLPAWVLILAHLFLFLGWSVMVLVVLGVLTAILLLFGAEAIDLRTLEEAPMEALGASALGWMTLVQNLGFAVGATFLVLLIPEVGSRHPFGLPSTSWGSALRTRLALQDPALVGVIAGLLLAPLAGLLSGWLSTTLSDLGLASKGLDQISSLLSSGTVASRLPLLVAVTIGAPICEEWVFRGYVWRFAERGSTWTAALLSSLLFAAFHMDPHHVLSLLPTAAFLALLRWRTGSLWPCIAAHFSNNAAAVAGSWASPATQEAFQTGFLLSSLGYAASVLVVLGLTRRASP